MTGRTGPVGVGVIGAGVISDQYLGNLTRFPDVEVRAVADLDVARAAAKAQQYGVGSAGTVDELLADDGIEIVVNLTIPAAHVEVAERVLAAGRHVWTEKPLALDRTAAAEVVAAGEAAGLRVASAPDTFLGAGIQSALRRMRAGELGDVHSALTLMQSPGPESWHPNPDFLFQAGAGPLFDIGPYYLTALVQFFGSIARVQAVATTARQERVIGSGPRAGERFAVTVPTHVSALYEFAGAATASSIFSFDTRQGRTLFELSSSDATLAIPDPNVFEGDLTIVREDATETVPAEGATAGRGMGVVELARAIRAGRPERASGRLALHVVDVMQTTIEAATTGTALGVHTTVAAPPPLEADWDPFERTL
ncbi:Gfo/Idh/MocA family oxidoreductase [Microbacterium lushaniae]|nr:Gfo/Idh/MocA family oxidoreductase [Microbacterium lushaniae]KAA9157359.1 Gfo/Idh/MocA family oxidoreductase [Microbacterium lushaniae]